VSLSRAELEGFVLALSARRDHWKDLIGPAPDARIYHQIWNDETVNAWLICWDRGHDTGWHDHDDSAAAIHVVEGQVQEERLTMTERPRARLLRPGGTFFVPASAIHRVRHAGWRPAVTVHAYSPPLTRTGAYTLGPGGELLREAQASDEELRAEPALL
jgi:quercetin dioxygenase-like cupin family protein